MQKSTLKNRILLLALLAVFTMLSMQGCKAVGETAIALEQRARCGCAEHIHTQDCYLDNILVCGAKAHTHDRNCYLLKLEDNDINELLGRVDETENKSLESLIGGVLGGALDGSRSPQGWESVDDGNALTNDDIMMLNRAISDGVVQSNLILNEELSTVYTSGDDLSGREALSLLAGVGMIAEGTTEGVSTYALPTSPNTGTRAINFYAKIDDTVKLVGTGSLTNANPDYYTYINIVSMYNNGDIRSTLAIGNINATYYFKYSRSSAISNSTDINDLIDATYSGNNVRFENRNNARYAIITTRTRTGGSNFNPTYSYTPVQFWTVTLDYSAVDVNKADDVQYVQDGQNSTMSLDSAYDWYDAETGGNKVTTTTPQNITKKTTLYASPKTFTASFENSSGTKIADDISGKPTNGKLNITLPGLLGEYSGYLWIIKGGDGLSYYLSDGTVNMDITADTTFVAIPSTYKVTFDSDGGSAVESQTLGYLNRVTKPTDPTREGYTFDGWQLNGADYNFSDPVTGDITLTARWKTKTYIVSFDSNGGSVVASQTVDHGKTATQAIAPTRTGYNFRSWQLNGADYNFNTPVTSDITLTATWEIKSYWLTFTDENGNALHTAQTVSHGSKIDLPTPPSGTNWYVGITRYSPGEIIVTMDMDFVALTTLNLSYVNKDGDIIKSSRYSPNSTVDVDSLPTGHTGYIWVDQYGREYTVGSKLSLTTDLVLTATPNLTINYNVNFPSTLSGQTFYPEGGLGNDPQDFNVSAVGVPRLNVNMGSSYTVSGITWADAPHSAEALNYREVFYRQGQGPAWEFRSVYLRGWQVTVNGEVEVIDPGEAISWDSLLEMAGSGTTINFTGLWEVDGYTTVTFYVNYSASAANDAGGNYGSGNAADYTPEVFCGHLFGLPSTQIVGTNSYNTYYGITGSNAQKSNLADAKIRELYGAGIHFDGVSNALGDTISGGSVDRAATLYMTDFPTDEEVLAKIKEWYQNGDLTKTLKYDDGTGKTYDVPNLDDLDTDHYTVRWYVFKSQSDGWHVDGRLIQKVGNIKITKVFDGNPSLVEKAITATEAYGTGKPFIVAKCTDTSRSINLYFVPHSDQNPYGYYIDDETGEYYWVVDGVQVDEEWVVMENPPDIVGSLDIAEHIWVDSINGISGSDTSTSVTISGVTYPSDAYNLDWLRADFTNIYHRENTILIRKVDGTTMDGISGAVFNLYSEAMDNTDSAPKLMYFTPVRETINAGTPNEYSYTVYEYDANLDAGTGVCDLPVGANGYLEYMVSGFSYETHNIIVSEKTAPPGYAAVGEITVGYLDGTNIGIKNSAGSETAGYADGVLTVKNYSGGSADVTAEKVWDCDEDYYKGHAVRFELYANGQIATSAIPGFATDHGSYYVYLDEKGAYVETNVDGTPKYLRNTPWSHTWTGLPTVLSGQAVTYTIVETQIGSEVADRTGNFPNWISDELYNNISTDSTGNQTVSIAIRNTPNRAMIRLTKYNTLGSTLSGAEFVMTELDKDGKEVGRSRADMTDEHGTITFDNLKYETWYRLSEVSPPEGHITLCDTVYVRLAATGVVTVTTDMNDFNATSPYAYYPGQANNVFVINFAATSLPETGGRGTQPYTIGGGLLMVAALLTLRGKFRRKEGEAPYV